MSTSNSNTHDSIDYVIDQISTRLISTQTINFKKLRQVVLLSNEPSDSIVYCNVIALAIIKYLDIGSDIIDKNGNFGEALRFYNALNLSDKKINTFFVEMILVLVPEIATALTSVLSKLSEELSRRNKSTFVNERINRLQRSLNNKIERKLIVHEETQDDDADAVVPRSKRESVPRNSEETMDFSNIVRKNERRRLISRFGENSIKADAELLTSRSKSDKTVSGSGGSNRFVELRDFVPKGSSRNRSRAGTVIGSERGTNIYEETASDTHRRLAARYKKSIHPQDSISNKAAETDHEMRRDRELLNKIGSESSW
jgi:hypothetical protein